MQERLWKSAAAAKLSHSIARKSREKLEERNMWQKQDARTLAKSIMQFKHSAETRAVMHGCNKDMLGRKFTRAEDKKEEVRIFSGKWQILVMFAFTKHAIIIIVSCHFYLFIFLFIYLFFYLSIYHFTYLFNK